MFYRYINNMKHNKNGIVSLKDSDDNLVTGDQSMVKMLNKHFSHQYHIG